MPVNTTILVLEGLIPRPLTLSGRRQNLSTFLVIRWYAILVISTTDVWSEADSLSSILQGGATITKLQYLLKIGFFGKSQHPDMMLSLTTRMHQFSRSAFCESPD